MEKIPEFTNQGIPSDGIPGPFPSFGNAGTPYMATFPESINQGIPSDGNPGPFPSFGNVGAPYMEMLSLPGLKIGLPVCFF